MLILPDITDEPFYRIVAFDPGTMCLGCAILDYNKEQGTYLVEHATTIEPGKLFKQYPDVIHAHGERVAKLHAVRLSAINILNAWTPWTVVSEGPFMGSFPQAYAALVECVDSIRRAVRDYSPFNGLRTIDPASVKKAVGVSGKSGDKEAVRRALKAMPSLKFAEGLSIDDLDEHAVDAIAVAIASTKI